MRSESRAQVRQNGASLHVAEATFDDVPTDHWAFRYVEYRAAEEIVHGYDPVTYGPTITVSRDQMAVFIARAFDLLM